MTDFAHGISITVLERDGGRDVYGDPIAPDSGAEQHAISGCAVAPRTSDESHERGRDGIVVGLTVFAPPTADILRDDRVLIDGYPGIWEVEGDPAVWASPFTGWAPGLQVALRRAEG